MTRKDGLFASPRLRAAARQPATPDELSAHVGLALVTSGGEHQRWRLSRGKARWEGLPAQAAPTRWSLQLALAAAGLGIVGLSERFARKASWSSRARWSACCPTGACRPPRCGVSRQTAGGQRFHPRSDLDAVRQPGAPGGAEPRGLPPADSLAPRRHKPACHHPPAVLIARRSFPTSSSSCRGTSTSRPTRRRPVAAARNWCAACRQAGAYSPPAASASTPRCWRSAPGRICANMAVGYK